jgi:hypothetical protein
MPIHRGRVKHYNANASAAVREIRREPLIEISAVRKNFPRCDHAC